MAMPMGYFPPTRYTVSCTTHARQEISIPKHAPCAMAWEQHITTGDCFGFAKARKLLWLPAWLLHAAEYMGMMGCAVGKFGTVGGSGALDDYYRGLVECTHPVQYLLGIVASQPEELPVTLQHTDVHGGQLRGRGSGGGG
jgi:hypothetical protein